MDSTSPSRSCRLSFPSPLNAAASSNGNALVTVPGSLPTRVASQVGLHRVGAAFESARYPNQVLDVHIRGQRIAARLGHFSLHIHAGRIDLRGIAMNQHPIARFEQNVIRRDFPPAPRPG